LETTVTNQNCIQGEVKSGLNFGNACYHAVQNHLSSRLLSENLKIICSSFREFNFDSLLFLKAVFFVSIL